MKKHSQAEVTIVGGGFAGLAAGLRLHRAGVRLQFLEKRPFFGGRAYSFVEPKTGEVVDNGQHLLMGAYHHTLQFLRDLKTDQHLAWQDQLEVHFAHPQNGHFQFRCPSLPAPLHLAGGLLGFKALSLRDKWRMVSLMRHIKKIANQKDYLENLSLLDLLKKRKQSPKAIQSFWEPLALATLNEPLYQANARFFVEVVQRALLSDKNSSKIMIPKVGFSQLYAQPAQDYFEQHQVPIHFNQQVSAIQKTAQGWELTNLHGDRFSSRFLILAIPPDALSKLVRDSAPELKPLAQGLEALKPSPIVSINLFYESLEFSKNFLGLIESPIHWIFNKSAIYSDSKTGYLSLVISGAYDLVDLPKERLIDLAQVELHKFIPSLKQKKLLNAQVIKEKTATFGGQPGLQSYRPGVKTSYPGIILAGDWIDTGLPATIESAVQSGHDAAQVILEM